MVDFNINFPLRDLGVSNALNLHESPRHRWYFVKEGFSPKLVKQAINTDEVAREELLLDPFSGSGTVALTGTLEGLKTHAFEVNPFLHFLSSTKLKQTEPGPLKVSAGRILKSLDTPVPSLLEGFSTFTEGNRWNRWLFPKPVLRSFEAGIQGLASTNGAHYDLLKLALIGAAMDCCNATRDGKCLRYPKGWVDNQATAADFKEKFESRIELIAEDLEVTPLNTSHSSVAEGDARQLVMAQAEEKFRLCITSPPYLNSFDYSDIYRPELFLGSFVASNKGLMNVRLKTIRSHVQANWEQPRNDKFGSIYQSCISEILEATDALWDKRIPTMIQAYFEDMETILKGLRTRADKKASVWLVVSTSAYAGIEVPVDLIIAEIGQRNGWFLRDVGVLRYMRSSSQHVKHVQDVEKKSVPLRESVVIFDTQPQR